MTILVLMICITLYLEERLIDMGKINRNNFRQNPCFCEYSSSFGGIGRLGYFVIRDSIVSYGGNE